MTPTLPSTGAPPGLSVLAAADIQDHLLVASNDLERLQRLLEDAGSTLMQRFHEAMALLQVGSPGAALSNAQELRASVSSAITALQFQDMATQLIAHTTQRLRNCADRLAAQTMGEDEDGVAVVQELPLRPNPVTQDEMDAGSVELF
jgi:hypothetical protein